jgi:DNA mismatch endonuclease (patch repair protein)
MADVHDRKTRSFNMSKIRSRDTKPELLVRKFLFARGFRYKLYDKTLPGKPDLVFPKYKAVLFIHGCFWHGHRGCKYFVIPKTRRKWWVEKITRNKQVDKENSRKLKRKGWKVLTIFECKLRSTTMERTLNQIANKITNEIS